MNNEAYLQASTSQRTETKWLMGVWCAKYFGHSVAQCQNVRRGKGHPCTLSIELKKTMELQSSNR